MNNFMISKQALLKSIFACTIILMTMFENMHAQDFKDQPKTMSTPAEPNEEFEVCATDLPVDYIAAQKMFKKWKAAGIQLSNRKSTATIIYLTAHRIRREGLIADCWATLGPGVPTASKIQDDVNLTNSYLSNYGFNVQFSLAQVNDICNDFLWETTNKDDLDICMLNTNYGVNGHMNVYYTNTSSFCPSYPWTQDVACFDNMLVLRNSDAGWGWTLAHEYGHWAGLYHTFETGKGREMVTRNSADACYNCETKGDLLCDTPADYGTGWCDSPGSDYCICQDHEDVDDCSDAIGAMLFPYFDSCASAYQPDFFNIMAYGCRPCANHFTLGQIERMYTYLASRLTQASITHGSCNVNISLPSVPISYGQRIEANGFISSAQVIQSKFYNMYDGLNYVDLVPGFSAEAFNGGAQYPDFEIFNEGCFGTHQITGDQNDSNNRRNQISNINKE